MRRPISLFRDESKPLVRARSVILEEALPRLLRLAPDPEVEGQAVLRAVQRRLDSLKGQANGALAEEVAAVESHARQLIETAMRAETKRRLPDLGNDGTP